MPRNLDNLTPIEALYRSRSYLQDYAGLLAKDEVYGKCEDLLNCVRQSAEQMETVAELMAIMERMMGNKMPPIPKRAAR